jgi:predicted nuclease of predicted toxin-antitoxin system
MRVLLDECVDPRVSLLLGDHKVATVHEQRWDTLEDGTLLAIAQREFDVLVTIDGNLEFQQSLSKFRIGIIVVHVAKNQLAHYRVLQRDLLAAIEKVRPGEAIHVRTPPV